MRTSFFGNVVVGLALAFSLVGYSAQYEEIVISDSNGTMVVSFDTRKISRKKVLRYLELRPGDEHLYRNPTCRVTQTADLEKFEKNCTQVIQLLKDKRIDLAKFDSGLSEVARFLRRRLDFTIYTSEMYLQFFRTGSFESFGAPYSGVVPETQCKEEIGYVRRIKERRKSLEAVTQKVSKCIEDQFYSREGRYPIESWNRFLKSLPIRVSIKESDEDRD